MSQSNEINFGPVFMRGRKPAPVTNKPTPNSNHITPQNQFNQAQRPNHGTTNNVLKPTNHNPTPGSFSPETHTSSLPLPKSFSAAVSPGKETDHRPHSNGFPSSAWEANLNHHNSQSIDSTSHVSDQQFSGPADYSRETLLNLYSENLASKLPPDLELSHPSVSVEFVGPPLALIEMTDTEKELFAGPFNSEKRSAANKLQAHHNIHDHTQGVTPSPDTSVNHGLVNNKLSVGGPVKLGKHNSIERFNSLGIQGGVLAGVASPSHSHPNARRRGDNELDSNESPRRFQRPDDSAAPWTATPRDRRTRDLAPLSDGKWKRGVSFEDKIQNPDSPGGANLKYSVLDKMREKAAGNHEPSPRDAHRAFSPTAPEQPAGAAPHQSHKANESSGDVTGQGFDDNPTSLSALKTESGNSQHVFSNGPEPSTGLTTHQSATNLNPENIAWQYRDPSGTVQGPFTAFQMQEWYKATFFRDDLLVKRVIDVAFETLETLILRVGDRDRPFLSRPPPALPPNLPVPQAHSHNHQPPTSQPSPRMPLSNALEQASSLPSQAEGLSAVDPTLPANLSSTPSQHTPMSAPDPWNGVAPGASPLPHPANIPASTPLTSASGWNSSSLPAFTAQPNLRNGDFVINDGLIDLNNVNLLNGLLPHLPHSFMSSDTLRFLQHVPHPALSMAAANGYPLPLPIPPPPPNFGQIPTMSHLSNSAINPLLAAQLHAQLMHSPYLFNNPVPDSGEGGEPHPERPSHHDNVMPHLHHPDPWQVSPPPPQDSSLGATDRKPTQSMATMSKTHTPMSFPLQLDDVGVNEPAAPQKSDDISQPVHTRSRPQSSELRPSAPGENYVKPKSQPVSAVNSEKEVTVTPVTPSHASTVISPSSNVSPGALEREPATSTSIPTQAMSVPNESARESLQSQPSPMTTLPESAATSDPTHPNQSWRNVAHQPAAKPSGASRHSASIAPSAPKSSGKVVVLSKAQQDEQDRRTASIQKAQLQLKEAQAVERAAREASEAAAAATAASFSTPAPWLKEEKPSSNLSLTEIQAIEAKQLEKRRLAEKQAAANRAMAEQAMAAERAMKAAKETLPATSNWAATTSSPTKQSVSGTVWGSKESEAPMTTNGPKQSMKQIQEEEARKKSLALQQQQQQPRPAPAAKTAGGYAGTVASSKPAVSGPWSVVGAKSKVIAPPAPVGVRSSSVTVPGVSSGAVRVVPSAGPTASKPVPKNISTATTKPTNKSGQSIPGSANNNSTAASNPTPNSDGPPPVSPEFMKWLREALRGMNNVDDFVKMLLDFPVNPDESVLEIVSDSVYAGSATLDGRRFAKEFNARRIADVAARSGNSGKAGVGGKTSSSSQPGSSGLSNGTATAHALKKPGYQIGSPSAASFGTMADAVKLQPAPKNDGWGFAVVGAKKKKK